MRLSGTLPTPLVGLCSKLYHFHPRSSDNWSTSSRSIAEISKCWFSCFCYLVNGLARFRSSCEQMALSTL
jgi:hypothetical protein